jgi:hypothetical protein
LRELRRELRRGRGADAANEARAKKSPREAGMS